MAKRKPSAAKLAKGLWRQAHEAEAKAAKLRELGFENHARGVSAAATALSNAAMFLEQKINQ